MDAWSAAVKRLQRDGVSRRSMYVFRRTRCASADGTRRRSVCAIDVGAVGRSASPFSDLVSVEPHTPTELVRLCVQLSYFYPFSVHHDLTFIHFCGHSRKRPDQCALCDWSTMDESVDSRNDMPWTMRSKLVAAYLRRV